MRLLLVASDPIEFRGVLGHGAAVRPAPLAADWARLLRLGANDCLLVANGVGWQRAAAAVDAACAAFAPEAIVSVGFCGALDPELDVGGIVAATAISGPDRSYPAQSVASARHYRSGAVCSIDHVARTAEEKRRLRATGAIAVEMEAAGVAASAFQRGLPLYSIRAVTDLAGETMANDFQASLRSDGHFGTMQVLGYSLRDPLARVPELLRLRRRCALAARNLGDFLADCRY